MKKIVTLCFFTLLLFTLCIIRTKAAGTVLCMYSTVDADVEGIDAANAKVGAAIVLDGNKIYIHYTESNKNYVIDSASYEFAYSLDLGDPNSVIDVLYGIKYRPDLVQHPLEWRSGNAYDLPLSPAGMLKERGLCPAQINEPKDIGQDQTRIYLYGSKIGQDGDNETKDLTAYYQYWSIFSDYYSTESMELYTKANNYLCSLTNGDMVYLTKALSFKFNNINVSGIAKHKFTQYLSNDKVDLFALAKNIEQKYKNGACTDFKDNKYFGGLYEAAEDYIYYYDLKNLDVYGNKTTECKKLLGDPEVKTSFAYYLHLTLKTVRYLGPAIVIALTTFEYISVVASGTAEALKKTNKRTVTRIIIMLLLFVLPVLIEAVLRITGMYGDCGIK